MGYTEIYRKIYSEVKTEKIDHESAHKISLRITEAISNLGMIVADQSDTVIDTVGSIIRDIYKTN